MTVALVGTSRTDKSDEAKYTAKAYLVPNSTRIKVTARPPRRQPQYSNTDRMLDKYIITTINAVTIPE